MSSRSSCASIFLIAELVLLLKMLAMASSLTLDEEAQLFRNERNDLIQLRDSLSSTMSLHSNWTGPPCYNDRTRWFGITCFKSKVTGVSLAGIQLTGSLPLAALQNVLHLTRLNLSDNALHGALPSLQGLRHLQAVSFAKNRFSGPIPAEFLALPNLSQLEFQDNVLSGTVPAFEQQRLAVFNVSYNFLEGRIPNNSVLQGFPSSSFDHNLGLCGRPLKKPCFVAAPPLSPPVSPVGNNASGGPSFAATSSNNKSLTHWMVALATICFIGLAFMVTVCFVYYLKRYTKKAKQKEDGDLEIEVKSSQSMPGQEKKALDLMFVDQERAIFDLDDLLRSSAEVIGKGNLGNTYKATLESCQVYAVKRLNTMNGMSKKGFLQQMQFLGRIKHDNLVEIISFHYSKEEKLVIYEYISGGSLFQLLHDNRGEARMPLKWSARLSIVEGIARGLAYLHQCMPSHKVPHANLKSSNVLIARWSHYTNFQPKFTDYGFYPILPSTHTHRLAIGKVPEFSQGKKLTHKADVYCFGLILLEVITGQAPSDGEENLPGWVKLVINNDWSTDILDLEIVSEKESHADMLNLTQIALSCTDLDPEKRPAMSQVVSRIEEIRAANIEIR
ncbi:putative leucine-rich repeat receptor-like protein kinase [Canna indica]|uniref:Leucine-rich repeat receptor-like protein kinase n=1 Tax=Canna indica TaxID=4628 RepID=A0AAQ3L1J9_9LILI|nr:putative leucine-rich repeat receptor-like protein kinase [Canna indica]